MNLITADQVEGLPTVEEGDAGIILKADGSWRIFNCYKGIDPVNLTARQIEQTHALMGFAAALRLPELMAVITDAAFNKDIFEKAVEAPRKQ